jgi:HlyD family secretion protein
MKFWLSLLLLAVLAGAGYWWWRPRQASDAEPVYRTAVAARTEIVQSVSATGQLSPLKTVQVGSQVSGTISELYVDFNDTVTNGQLVAEIDPGTYAARVVQAEAQLDSAKANYQLKKLTADRSAELLKNQIVAQSDYDTAMAELRQQEASVRIAEASVQNARLDLDRTKIHAPIDGVVISRDVDKGQTVQASFSAPKLFSIAQDLREMEIAAAVSEADIGSVAPGQFVRFHVDAFPDRDFSGTVRQVRANSVITQNVVTYSTIITVANDDLKLLPGMTATVDITTARRPNAIVVSNAALRFKPPENAIIRAPEAPAVSGDTAGASTELTIDQIPGLEEMPAEFRQRMFDRHDTDKNGKLNPTELAALQEARTRFAARGGPGGGGGGSGAGGGRESRGGGGSGNGGTRTARPPQEVTKTVYVLAEPPAPGLPAKGELIAKTVRIGINNGASTEILSGLEEHDLVVLDTIDANAPAAKAAAAGQQTRNPFAPQFPRGGGGRR